MDGLIYVAAYSSMLEARAREAVLKKWRRAWKIQIVQTNNPDWKDIPA